MTNYKNGKKKKVNYLNEIDWNVVTHMAERMATNKHKYKPYNWKKEITPAQLEDLKQATIRHFIAFVNGDYARRQQTLRTYRSNYDKFNDDKLSVKKLWN